MKAGTRIFPHVALSSLLAFMTQCTALILQEGDPERFGQLMLLDIGNVPDEGASPAITTQTGTFATSGRVASHQKISDTEGYLKGLLTDSYGLGHALTTIGDLDDDGITDVALGAYGDDDMGSDRGAVFVIFMQADGNVRAYQKISDASGNFTAPLEDHDRLGSAVAAPGDIDGDGVEDLVVGAECSGPTCRGAVYVWLMNTDGTVKSHQKIDENATNFSGTLDDNDHFGITVTGIGDLDRDGVPDIAVGAYADDDGGDGRGAVYVIRLNADGSVKARQKVSDTQGNFSGDIENGNGLGRSVTGIGDLDGDGTVDIVAGAPFTDAGGSSRGTIWIWYMNADGTVASYQKISQYDGFFSGNLWNGDRLGESILAPGDLDGDGVIDLVAGAVGTDSNKGAIWTIFLNPDGTVKAEQQISESVGNFTGGLDDGDHFGMNVTVPGDLSGDGVPDYVVGSWLDDDGGHDRGALYVLHMEAAE